ncbi:MAG: hypothetical protein K2Q20_02825 [Phycisphaerales bacterium]|nr:hypothetical protein [Phycisphaerales bacterium]
MLGAGTGFGVRGAFAGRFDFAVAGLGSVFLRGPALRFISDSHALPDQLRPKMSIAYGFRPAPTSARRQPRPDAGLDRLYEEFEPVDTIGELLDGAGQRVEEFTSGGLL